MDTSKYRVEIAHIYIESVVDLDTGFGDIIIRGKISFENSAGLSNSRNDKPKDRKREESDCEGSAQLRSGEELDMRTHARSLKFHKSTSDNATNVPAIIASFENVWDNIDLVYIDIDRALSKLQRSGGTAIFAANLNRKIRYRDYILYTGCKIGGIESGINYLF